MQEPLTSRKVLTSLKKKVVNGSGNGNAKKLCHMSVPMCADGLKPDTSSTRRITGKQDAVAPEHRTGSAEVPLPRQDAHAEASASSNVIDTPLMQDKPSLSLIDANMVLPNKVLSRAASSGRRETRFVWEFCDFQYFERLS